VCRDFIAPKHIDPKFLDPKHVFKDLGSLPTSITVAPVDPSSSAQGATAPATQGSTSAAANAAAKIAGSNHAHANVFMPEKKRRHREGYAEGDYTMFHAAAAEDFVKGTDPVTLLGMMNKIEFVSDEEKS
jgi:AdoMet-dependent rRNA methyltransferase SPB1